MFYTAALLHRVSDAEIMFYTAALLHRVRDAEIMFCIAAPRIEYGLLK